MDSLPDELAWMVLIRMPWRSRLRSRAVCRRWRDILSGPAAWRDVPRERPHYALMVACRHGAIDVAARLTIQFGLTDDFDAEDYGFFEIFCRACEDGNLPVIEWLATTFKLTADDIRTEGNEALIAACSGGNFEVVRWLIAAFDLTADDVRDSNNAALQGACSEGRLEIARWLVETFSLTRGDARASHNYALNLACSGGHLNIVQWLVETFGLLAADAIDCDAVETATDCYHDHIADWLTGRFGLQGAG